MSIPIPSDLNKPYCCLSKLLHIAIVPIQLECGNNACKLCFDESTNKKCIVCSKPHEIKDGNINRTLNIKLKQHETFVKDFTQESLNSLVTEFKDKDYEEEIDTVFKKIQEDVHARVESLIKQLHTYENSFINEIEKQKKEIKEKFIKRYFQQVDDKIKNKTFKSKEVVDYDAIVKKHQILIEYQKYLSIYKDYLKALSFNSSEENFPIKLIGSLNKQDFNLDTINVTKTNDLIEDFLKYEKPIETPLVDGRKKKENDLPQNNHPKLQYKTLDVPLNDTQHLGRIAFVDDDLVISDYEDRSIKFIDLKCQQMEIFRNEKISKPWCLCVNNKKEIFVGDLTGNKILLLDYQTKTLCDFEISMDANLKASNITFDLKDNNLYVSHWSSNKVSIYSEGQNSPRFIDVDSPLYIEFTKENIYILSYTEYESAPNTNKLIKKRKGSNCIFVYNRNNLTKEANIIRLDNWLAPVGLHIDGEFNVLTTAFKLDENKIISSNRFLFVINQDGNLINEVELACVNQCNSMSFSNDKLVITSDKSFKQLEFDYVTSC